MIRGRKDCTVCFNPMSLEESEGERESEAERREDRERERMEGREETKKKRGRDFGGQSSIMSLNPAADVLRNSVCAFCVRERERERGREGVRGCVRERSQGA